MVGYAPSQGAGCTHLPTPILGLFRCLLTLYMLEAAVYYLPRRLIYFTYIEVLLEGMAEAEWAADSQVQP